MKYSRREVRGTAYAIPALKFENQSLTSFAGLVVFPQFFALLRLKARLAWCFAQQTAGKVFGRGVGFLPWVAHLLLGYRELRKSRSYENDPLGKWVLGLRRLPDVATLSRMRKEADAQSVANLRQLLRDLVFERLVRLALPRITLDFDGSVLSTRRHAEGPAVGFHKKKKAARSFYPLFCTIAQTGQVLDFLPRSGNVHDSHGAGEFISACIQTVREALPGMVVEVRRDSAFFSDEIVMALEDAGIEFTGSAPFERFAELKGKIEGRKRWQRLSSEAAYLEEAWKPQVGDRPFRFLFIRTLAQRPQKGPLHLDLFVPHESGYDFKVIGTNNTLSPQKVVAFHEKRGSQEGIFGELKTHCPMGYVPVRKGPGNQRYLLAAVFAHNLLRERQMMTNAPTRGTPAEGTPLWAFAELHTFRAGLIQQAGRLTRPHGILTLTISASHWIKNRLLAVLNAHHNAV